MSSEKSLFMYQISVVNGDLPPNGRLMILFKSGMLAVSRVCLPLPNTSSATPLLKRMASWDSFTISCVHVPSSSLGYFHANTSGFPLYFTTSIIAIKKPPHTDVICLEKIPYKILPFTAGICNRGTGIN